MTWRSKSSSLHRRRLGYLGSEASPLLCLQSFSQWDCEATGISQGYWGCPAHLTYLDVPGLSTWSGWAWVDWIRLATSPVSLSTPRCGRFDSVSGPGWEGGARWSMEIWSLVPLPFPNPAWTSGSSWFVYCWSDTVFPWCKWCVLMLAASCSVVLMLRFWGTLNYKSLDKLGDRICNPRVKIMSVTRVKQWEF